MADKEIASFGSELGGKVVIFADTVTGLVTKIGTPSGTVAIGGAGGTSTIAGATDYSTAKLPAEQADITALSASIPNTALQVHAVPVSQGSYNAATNTPAWTPDSAPSDNVPCRTVTVAGTMTIASVPTSLFVGDEIYWNGTTTTVVRGVPATTAIKKGDGLGALVDAVLNVDYAPAGTVLAMNVPWGLPPSGSTIGANGAVFTAATAFLETYNAPGVWLYFNAGEVAAGSIAGFYPVVMSSTTAGVVSNNPVAAGSTHAAFAWPAALTPFTTNAGSTTAGVTNTYIFGPTTTQAAGCIGKNGYIEFLFNGRNNNSAGAKNLMANFAGGQTIGTGVTTVTAGGLDVIVANKSSYSLQVGTLRATTALAPAPYAINTNAAFTTGFSVRTAVATDWLICSFSSIQTVFVA